ncbi:MAG: pyridoxal-dependent decarboxylase, partial [Pseudomonadota bacterium]
MNRPEFDPADDLNRVASIDYNELLAPIVAQRTESPIIRRSTAQDVEAMLEPEWSTDGGELRTIVTAVVDALNQYPRRNSHPGFFGWIAPSGVGTDALSSAMTALYNENVGGYWASPVGVTVENLVLRWLIELTGLPHSSEGVLLSGGSMANTTAMAASLARKYGPELRERGLIACSGGKPPTVLCSRAAHFSIQRAGALLGIGLDNVIAVDVDEQFCMRSDALAAALREYPNTCCVVGTAGTTNTGAIDPLTTIADLCAAHNVW